MQGGPGFQTTANQNLRMVRGDVQGQCYVAGQEDFLKTLLHIEDSIIDATYAEAVEQKLYNPKTKKWLKLPLKPKDEEALYQPFVQIANALLKIALALPASIAKDFQRTIPGLWVDRHSVVPKSRDPQAASIRPDLSFHMLTKEESDALEHAIAKALERRISRKDASDVARFLTAWWVRMHVPVEVKPTTNPTEVLKGVVQLLGYIRQIFREQLDRRFVFGLLFAKTDLTVWLADRSGVLGMDDSFNVHKAPKKFIQVILAMSTLPPERLGWDPTMRLCRLSPDSPGRYELMHSYEKVSLKDYEKSLYHTHWAIDMPVKSDGKKHGEKRGKDGEGPEGNNGKHEDDDVDKGEQPEDKRDDTVKQREVNSEERRDKGKQREVYVEEHNDKSRKREEYETFITVRALSVARAEIMCGRGTIVWQAVKLADLTKADGLPKSYVLKQCWRPQDSTSEGEFYDAAAGAEHIGQIYSHADVNTRNGKPVDVDTQSFIRCGLNHASYTLQADENGKRVLNDLEDQDRQEQYLHIRLVNNSLKFFTMSRSDDVPTYRVHSRMAMKTYGWPLKYFLDFVELLRVLCDIITAHLTSYYGAGIVHRDFSIGNMLISPKEGGGYEGRLIDFDYAKIAPLENAPTRTYSQDEVDELVGTLKLKKLHMEENVATLLLRRKSPHDSVGLVNYCLERNPALREKSITAEDLGFYVETKPIPAIWERQAASARRSATVPFASYEVLAGETMFSTEIPFIHGPVHDMEALFWVVTYLCLTRQGPGGHRRPEFKAGADLAAYPDADMLFHIVDCFFDSLYPSVLAKNKQMLFVYDHYKDYVVRYFHPYFKPMEPLLLEWWEILRGAYKFRTFETIQQRFLQAIQRHSAAIAHEQIPAEEATKAEEARRNADLETIQRFADAWREGRSVAEEAEDEWDRSPGHPRATKADATYLAEPTTAAKGANAQDENSDSTSKPTNAKGKDTAPDSASADELAISLSPTPLPKAQPSGLRVTRSAKTNVLTGPSSSIPIAGPSRSTTQRSSTMQRSEAKTTSSTNAKGKAEHSNPAPAVRTLRSSTTRATGSANAKAGPSSTAWKAKAGPSNAAPAARVRSSNAQPSTTRTTGSAIAQAGPSSSVAIAAPAARRARSLRKQPSATQTTGSTNAQAGPSSSNPAAGRALRKRMPVATAEEGSRKKRRTG